jgi:hypothetical protein
VTLVQRTPVRLAAAGVFVFLLFLFLLLPPSPTRLDARGWSDLASRTVAGAYHVHSRRSDGAADKHTIAQAAARAGLAFVILTDHGDGTRPPDPPEYLEGVLCVDAVEISTDEGHYVALDMRPSPYPLGGAAQAVVEDVARLGGFGVAAHPDSPKPELRWTDQSAPIDGIEWLNEDSEWRNESRASLSHAGLAYFLRPGPALATLLDRPATLDRWDRLTKARRVLALAGIDAHGGVGRRMEDGSLSGVLGIPSYEASFRTFSVRVLLDRPWTGSAAGDARALMDAIRSGRVYTTIDALAAPGLLAFQADAGDRSIPMGGGLPPGTPITLSARVLKPPSAEVVLLRSGQEVASTRDAQIGAPVKGEGAYRIEVRLPNAPGQPPIPWLVSNPIYVLPPEGGSHEAGSHEAELPPAGGSHEVPADAWQIEKDPGSSAILRTSRGVELEYTLRPGPRASQYVAIAAPLSTGAIDAVRLTLAANRPSRVSIQLRTAGGLRWRRSEYVSTEPRTVALRAPDFRPIDRAPDSPAGQPLTSLLIVIDLTNASPGRSGTLRILDARVVVR